MPPYRFPEDFPIPQLPHYGSKEGHNTMGFHLHFAEDVWQRIGFPTLEDIENYRLELRGLERLAGSLLRVLHMSTGTTPVVQGTTGSTRTAYLRQLCRDRDCMAFMVSLVNYRLKPFIEKWGYSRVTHYLKEFWMLYKELAQLMIAEEYEFVHSDEAYRATNHPPDTDTDTDEYLQSDHEDVESDHDGVSLPQ